MSTQTLNKQARFNELKQLYIAYSKDKNLVNLDQSPDDLAKAILIIKKYNCIKDTIDRARHFTNVAIDSLETFENNEYRKTLMNLISASLNRFN